jgi:hypothetical protein
MCFLFSLFPATVLAVLGYVVLYCSTKADGAVKTFGKILAIWVFVVAVFPPIIGAYVTIASICPIDGIIEKMSAQK